MQFTSLILMMRDDCTERERERGDKRQGEGEGGREGEREKRNFRPASGKDVYTVLAQD